MNSVPIAEVAAQFQVRPTSDSHFAWLRTRIAVERTLMAWVRTAVALIGFGFTIVQFFERFSSMPGVAPAERPQAPRHLGLTLIAMGVAALIISTIQYRRIVLYLHSTPFEPIVGLHAETGRPVVLQTPLMAVAIILTLVGVFAFVAVLARAV